MGQRVRARRNAAADGDTEKRRSWGVSKKGGDPAMITPETVAKSKEKRGGPGTLINGKHEQERTGE